MPVDSSSAGSDTRASRSSISASGLAGNLVSLVVQGDRAVSGGASGAIFGVIGALLVCLARERRQVDPGEFRWLFWGGGAFALASLALGFVIPGIDNAAHLGGLFTGALLGVALGRSLLRERPIAPAQRAIAAALLAAAVGAVRLQHPGARATGSARRCRRVRRSASSSPTRRASTTAGSRSSTPAAAAAPRSTSSPATIDSEVSREYQDSFEQLSAIALSPGAPSAADLEFLRRYALLRGDAAHDLAEALRANDPAGIRRALDKMRQAQAVARSASAASR